MKHYIISFIEIRKWKLLFKFHFLKIFDSYNSSTRFSVKKQIQPADGNLAFHQKVLLAAVSGLCGGIVGTPADMVNVRMQNDVKLPADQRRNYKHAVDGLFRVYK